MKRKSSVAKLRWEKKGQILSLSQDNIPKWMNSYAQNPAAVLFDDFVRVYFNTRPETTGEDYVSYPAYVDLDRNNPANIVKIAKEPVLSLGGPGCFDQFGCMSGNIIRNGNELWMYYVGWVRSVAVPYNWAIGLAVSSDNGDHFDRMFEGPIIGAQFNEPFLQNGQYVVKEAPNKWYMWYSTGKVWIEYDCKMESVYVIVYAHSEDGIHWQRTGESIIPFAFENETQTTPTVFKWNEKYHMIFSSRHSIDFRNAERGYRLGYAWSEDLKTWHRDDSKVGIGTSDSGWDSEMICYPHVVEIDSKFYLFYCGNHFGRDGFGYAIFDKENINNSTKKLE